MSRFILDRQNHVHGEHGLHSHLVHDLLAFCRQLPEAEHWISLGEHDNILLAMEKALQLYPQARLCEHCFAIGAITQHLEVEQEHAVHASGGR